jgi:hypothetical protein
MIKKKRQAATGMLPETKEKIFLVIFLIFAITVIILLFKAPQMGKAILGTQLDSQTYRIGDKINGTVNLELQEGDVLPQNAQVQFFIQTNATKTPTEICGKLIRNCGFGNGFLYWTPKNLKGGTVSNDSYAVAEDAESKIIVTDTTDITGSGYAAVKQTISEMIFATSSAGGPGPDIRTLCNRANPVINISNASQTGTPGTLKSYVVNVTNKDSSSCNSSNFNFSYSGCPSGWTCTVSPTWKSIASNANILAFVLKVTPSSTATSGSYKINVTVTNANVPAYKASASATYTIGAGPSCSGTSSLGFSPSPASINSNVDATFGILKSGSSTGCVGKTVTIYQSTSCSGAGKCSCTLPAESVSGGEIPKIDTGGGTASVIDTNTYSTSCKCSLTTPSTAQTASYTACIDGTAKLTKTLTITAQPTCVGNLSLYLYPADWDAEDITINSSVIVSTGVTREGSAGSFNYTGCANKTITIKKDSCSTGTFVTKCRLTPLNELYPGIYDEEEFCMELLGERFCEIGCEDANFTAPSAEGNYTYYACLDMNNNNQYSTNEYDYDKIEVVPASCTYKDVKKCSLGGHTGLQQCLSSGSWSTCKPFKLVWDVSYYSENPCAFEIMLKGSDDHTLHYYYNLSGSGCAKPTSNSTDKYVFKSVTMDDYLTTQSAYIFDDWAWTIPSDFNFNEMWLISHGNYVSDVSYGQVVRWDNVDIITSVNETSQNCTARGKKCCTAGSGSGSYYELDCSEGQECWSDCASSYSMPLKDFITNSDPKSKYNKTSSGLFTYMKPVSEQLPGELCGADTGISGFSEDMCLAGGDEASSANQGYTFCSDTSSTAKPSSCKDWDNVYEFSLGKVPVNNRKVPSQNGSYNYFVRIVYTPKSGYCGSYLEDDTTITRETCNLYETSQAFTVGAGGGACTPRWVNCTNTTKCDASTNYTEFNVTVCTDANACGQACPAAICKTWGATGKTCPVALRSCMEDDYTCGAWTPALCKPNSKQTTTCGLTVPDTCNATTADATAPSLERNCSKEVIKSYAQSQETAGKTRKQVESSLKTAGWPASTIKEVLDEVYAGEEPKPISMWVWITIAVVLVAALALVLMLRKKKGGMRAGKKAAPPELISYIRDALGTGATKAEIATRLIQAGWPRDSVDAAMKALRL